MLIMLFAFLMHQSVKISEEYPITIPILSFGTGTIVRLAYRKYKKFGVDAWEKFWIPAFYRYGQMRADYIKEKMNIDVDNPASIGRYHDYEDPIFGVEGHWEEDDEGNAVRVETSCIICEKIDKVSGGSGCPDFCRYIVRAMEEGTGKTMNDKYVVEIGALLTDGDDTCRFTHKLRK